MKEYTTVSICEFDKFATQSYLAIHGKDESINLGDITKVDETKLEPFTMVVGGSPCFEAGTMVITKNGYKNIENINVGDFVLTHNNRYRKVLRVGNKISDTVKLKAQGILPTVVTTNHPYYIDNNQLKSPVWKEVDNLTKHDYIGIPIIQEESNIYNLTMEDCWLLGRYLADGHYRKDKRKNRNNSFQYQVIYSIGNDKLDQFRDKVSRHFSCYPHSQSVHRCVISSEKMVDFIIKHNFGLGAENKRIPQFILELPIDLASEFLEGYMSGDGSSSNLEGIYQAGTASKELAMGLCLLIAKCKNINTTIHLHIPEPTTVIEGRTVNQLPHYQIRFREPMRERTKAYVKNNIIWNPFGSIEKYSENTTVYNLEVEGDNSYTANNAIVHNCQDFSVAGKQKGAVWTCKDCGHEYNPLTVHWSERDKCPECQSNNIEKTRSSLLVEWLRIIRANKPNFGIYENVKNIVGKEFKETTFKMFENELNEYGYNTYWQVLNAKNYGIPQNRERVYLILIKKELDNGKFKFPKGFDNGLRLKDILEDEVDEKYYISDEKLNNIIIDKHKNTNNVNIMTKLNSSQDGVIVSADGISPTHTAGHGNCPKVLIKQATKQGYIECNVGGVADLSYPDSKTRRGRVQDNGDTCPTITATETGVCYIEPLNEENQKYIDNISSEYEFAKAKCQEMLNENGSLPEMFNPYNKAEITEYAPTQTTSCNRSCSSATVLKKEANYRIRKLTPKECFRLMGFADEDFDKAKQSGTSDSQLYKQAGNSIVVNVLFEILLELYKTMPYLFDDLRLSSYFSGIGAFEKALDMLYEYINTGEIKQLNFTRPQVD